MKPATKGGVAGPVADVIKLRFRIEAIAAIDNLIGTVAGLHIIVGKP